ncbi:hypothetical protein GEV33_012972 [Tenebrio molitor]|uniref:Uncharacterized protein n=1 Tax=Tenebrio molitor TaxID=7067 RepID=A0A8J6H8T4_TENMO|nr:hypothetical protein GEV33_012972 [Tenebrio molitor]
MNGREECRILAECWREKKKNIEKEGEILPEERRTGERGRWRGDGGGGGVGDLTDALKSCFVADLGEHLEQLPAGGLGSGDFAQIENRLFRRECIQIRGRDFCGAARVDAEGRLEGAPRLSTVKIPIINYRAPPKNLHPHCERMQIATSVLISSIINERLSVVEESRTCGGGLRPSDSAVFAFCVPASDNASDYRRISVRVSRVQEKGLSQQSTTRERDKGGTVCRQGRNHTKTWCGRRAQAGQQGWPIACPPGHRDAMSYCRPANHCLSLLMSPGDVIYRPTSDRKGRITIATKGRRGN